MHAKTLWKVAFTRHAEKDIQGILTYMAASQGRDLALSLLDAFIAARDSLSHLPERGRMPPELLRIAVLSYREIQVKPYRLVYQIDKNSQKIFVHMIVDGRRNLTELLKARLLTVVD